MATVGPALFRANAGKVGGAHNREQEQINDLLRKIAVDYEIPIWDFARVSDTLPGRGLGPDGVHLTSFFQHDYTLPQAFQRGHGVQNLTALILLDKIWRVLEKP